MDNRLKGRTVHCSNCNGLIHYGDDPIISDPNNDKVYCGIECFLDSHMCYMLRSDDFDAKDAYDTWFKDEYEQI